MSSKSDIFGVLGVSGYEIVLFRAQGPCLRGMHLFSRAPNMRGKVLIFAHIIGNFCAAFSYLSISFIGMDFLFSWFQQNFTKFLFYFWGNEMHDLMRI